MEFHVVAAHTTIRIVLLVVLANIFAEPIRADWPEFDRSMNGIILEATYDNKRFVGFKATCLDDELVLAKRIARLYERYLNPFTKDAVGNNDTIVIISQYNPRLFGEGVESIYIHTDKTNIGVLRDNRTVLREHRSDNYATLLSFETCWSTKYQCELCNIAFMWNQTKLINMFCTSNLYGNHADNHGMNIYRIVIIDNKIAEYISISCSADTRWQTSPGLFYEMLSPYSQHEKWGATKAAFLRHTRPPETIEKPMLMQ